MASEAIYCIQTNHITPVFVNKDIGKLGEVTVALETPNGHFSQRIPIASTKTPYCHLPDDNYRRVKDIYNEANYRAIRKVQGTFKIILDKAFMFKCPAYFFVPNEQMKKQLRDCKNAYITFSLYAKRKLVGKLRVWVLCNITDLVILDYDDTLVLRRGSYMVYNVNKSLWKLVKSGLPICPVVLTARWMEYGSTIRSQMIDKPNGKQLPEMPILTTPNTRMETAGYWLLNFISHRDAIWKVRWLMFLQELSTPQYQLSISTAIGDAKSDLRVYTVHNIENVYKVHKRGYLTRQYGYLQVVADIMSQTDKCETCGGRNKLS